MKVLDLIVYTALLACLSSDGHRENDIPFASSPTVLTLKQLDDTATQEKFPLLPQWMVDFFNSGELIGVHTPNYGTLEHDVSSDEWVEDSDTLGEEPEDSREEPEEEAPWQPVYYYGDPVPESTKVDDSYFYDAAIIGDSRSQGLVAFGGLGGGANLTGLGLSVYNLWDKQCVDTGSGMVTVLKALEQGSYKKVYISLGMNSLGYPSIEKFYNNYANFIDEIRLRQPEADIYVQNIIPLNEPVIRSRNGASYFTNGILEQFNSYIQKLAVEKDLFYVDLYHHFLDDSGQLPQEATSDGIHLSATYTKMWAEYLKTHTVNREEYEILSPRAAEEVSDWVQGEIYVEAGEVAAS